MFILISLSPADFQKFMGRRLAASSIQWRDTAEGRLAEIIVLDQFSRNIYRDSPLSFATDSLALALAQEAIRAGADKDDC